MMVDGLTNLNLLNTFNSNYFFTMHLTLKWFALQLKVHILWIHGNLMGINLLFKQEELYEYFDSLNTQQICN